MQLESHIERITKTADILNESILSLDTDINAAKYRGDLLLKVALAYYIQDDMDKAHSFIAQAKQMPGMKGMFREMLDFWEKILNDGNSFETSLGAMNVLQRLVFEIMFYYSAVLYHELPQEIREAVSCVSHGNTTFLSRGMYKNKVVPQLAPGFDVNEGLFYFDISGRRLYYAANEAREVAFAHNFIQNNEQVPHSPHLYFTEDFCPRAGDVFCDIGAGEANASFAQVDVCDKIYIFEGDAKWEKPLAATFAPYMDKVTFVHKMVSDAPDDDVVTLDDYFGEAKVDFLKMDVEGYELRVLLGAEGLLAANKKIKLCVCTYHKGEDVNEIKSFLEARGFTCEFSEGFMVFADDEMFHEGSDPAYPYFRRGLIRAWRE